MGYELARKYNTYVSSENLGTAPQRGTFPGSLARFPVKSLQISRILTKFAMKLYV